jgi:vacuolar protein sorting-associated protein 72
MSVFVEIMNMRNLERVLAREEEVKKKAVVQKAIYEGPTIRFYSRDGNSSIPICLHTISELSSYSFLCFLFPL